MSAISQEIGSSWEQLGLVIISSMAMVAGIILYVRIAGLRSFSKMSSFDFAITVAFGSLIASTAVSGSSLADGIVAAGSLLGVQFAIALCRSRFRAGVIVDNQPMMLMRNGAFLTDNLLRTRVTEDDVRAKLREANVTSFDEVLAVVLETTGNISVLHGGGHLDLDLLSDVRP